MAAPNPYEPYERAMRGVQTSAGSAAAPCRDPNVERPLLVEACDRLEKIRIELDVTTAAAHGRADVLFGGVPAEGSKGDECCASSGVAHQLLRLVGELDAAVERNRAAVARFERLV